MSHALTLFALALLGPTPGPATAVEDWTLTLPEAVVIGMNNSENVRVVTVVGSGLNGVFQAPPPPTENLVIAPVVYPGDEDGVWKFKGEVMAEIRAIEQKYWELAAWRVKVEAIEKTSQTIRDLIKREESELEVSRGGNVADIAELQQALEKGEIDLATAWSDLAAADRRFRELLGLPGEDDRRIVPVSTPRAKLDAPEGPSPVAEMMEHQPEIVRQKRRVDLALVQWIAARNQLTYGPPTNVRQAKDLLAQERNHQEQVVHEASRTLARLLLEGDVDHRRYLNAVQAREKAAARLEVQRAYYEEGRITGDRYLTAIAGLATATCQEGQALASDQAALAAIEEAKGTLLEARMITVARRPRPRSYRRPTPVVADGSDDAEADAAPSVKR